MSINAKLTAGLVTGAFVLGLGLARSAFAQASGDMTPELNALAAAATKEGQLVVKWSSQSFGGPQGAKVFEKHINENYGSSIQIRWTPGGAMPDVGNEIAIAFRNNQPASTDVYIGFSRNIAVLLKYDMFQSGDYKKYLPGRITDEIVERDTYAKVYSSAAGISYNKTRAPFVPERLADLLKPGWKGKIATTPFAAGFELLASNDALGPEKAIALAEDYSKQVAGFMLCNDADRLASGEFIAFAFDCGGNRMVHAAAKGAPIARSLVPEVPVISYFYLAVPKNATNPNAAKLFITYALSEKGQRDLWDLEMSDLHLFPESNVRKEILAVEQKFGFKYKSADIDWQVSANEAGNAAQRKIVEILKEGRR